MFMCESLSIFFKCKVENGVLCIINSSCLCFFSIILVVCLIRLFDML